MRNVALLSVGVLLFPATAFADTDACLSTLYQKYAAGIALKEQDFQACGKPLPTPAPPPRTKRVANVATAPSPEPAAKPRPIPDLDVYRTFFLLRKDSADIGIFDDPVQTNSASGAQFSISNDRIASNTSWSVNAMASVVFQYINNRDNDGFGLAGFSLAPYVHVQRIQNSNPKSASNNLDQTIAGGSGEIGFDMLGGAHYFRASGASVWDQISDTTSGSAIFEWMPVYKDARINYPFGIQDIPMVFIFEPKLVSRRDDVIVNDTTGRKEYHWRTGPEMTLRYRLQSNTLPWYLNKLHGQTTYSNLFADGGQSYSYFDTSLTYDIDKDGHVGITTGYTNGRNQDTGRRIDLWKTTLSAKW